MSSCQAAHGVCFAIKAWEDRERLPRRGEEEALELGVGVGRGHFQLEKQQVKGAGVERGSTVCEQGVMAAAERCSGKWRGGGLRPHP